MSVKEKARSTTGKHPKITQAHAETPDQFKAELVRITQDAIKSGVPADLVYGFMNDWSQDQLATVEPGGIDMLDALGLGDLDD